MIIDTIKASEAEDGDLLEIMVDSETHRLEDTSVVDSGDIIAISGYSHLTGDRETFPLPADTIIHIWTE